MRVRTHVSRWTGYLFLIVVAVLSFGVGVVLQWRFDLVDKAPYYRMHVNALSVGSDLCSYSNSLVPVSIPQPILGQFPQFSAPITADCRYESPPLVDDERRTLCVRAWRYSYNARGIIEIPNYLDGRRTAVIVVHPWGIEDGQGWKTSEPAGASFFGTPAKNHLYLDHTRLVLAPFIQRMRGHVALILYSLPGRDDEARKRIYRGIDNAAPLTPEGVDHGRKALDEKLNGFNYGADPIPPQLYLSKHHPVASYFQRFPGLDASERYEGRGYWELPVPLVSTLPYREEDVVFYDGEGRAALREYLWRRGIRHILLAGYATDVCVKETPAGYDNLKQQFDIFMVGDATLATFPAQGSPGAATTVALAKASLEMLITQVSWISVVEDSVREETE